jgi:hypothetical protein
VLDFCLPCANSRLTTLAQAIRAVRLRRRGLGPWFQNWADRSTLRDYPLRSIAVDRPAWNGIGAIKRTAAPSP